MSGLDSSGVSVEIAQQDGQGDYWHSLVNATSLQEAAGPWLSAVCSQMENVQLAGLVALDSGGNRQPLGHWPANDPPLQKLDKIIELAQADGRGALKSVHGGTLMAYPIRLDEDICAIIALSTVETDMDMLRANMRQLQWSAGWLRDVMRREAADSSSQQKYASHLALDIIGHLIEPATALQSEQELLHKLVSECSLERASIGYLEDGKMTLSSISHSASFGKEMSLVRLIEAAMSEATDQDTFILFPNVDKDIPVKRDAHQALSNAHKTGALLTIPLLERDSLIGALMLEHGRGAEFSQSDIDLLSGVVAYSGPLLMEKWRDNRHILRKNLDALKMQYGKLVGQGYTGRKIVSVGSIILLLLMVFATGRYEVTATGGVKGSIQRAVSAPFDGFILLENVRAGDEVSKGSILAALDDRDLALERLNWVSQKQEMQFEYNRALGERKRAEIGVYEARMAQADIQLDIIDKQLARSRLKAQFDGLVVSGDLSQRIGSAVRRGEVLYEIAPLGEYRLTLHVDESQIAHVAAGMKGRFLTSSLPDTPFAFTVKKVTPVAVAEDGRTVFKVEASIEEGKDRLNPGMEGLGKIDAGEARLIWIWTRSFTDWVRLKLWSFGS